VLSTLCTPYCYATDLRVVFIDTVLIKVLEADGNVGKGHACGSVSIVQRFKFNNDSTTFGKYYLASWVWIGRTHEPSYGPPAIFNLLSKRCIKYGVSGSVRVRVSF